MYFDQKIKYLDYLEGERACAAPGSFGSNVGEKHVIWFCRHRGFLNRRREAILFIFREKDGKSILAIFFYKMGRDGWNCGT